MRITIDTELQAIIVPNSYYNQIDKLNEIIIAAGGKKLDYTQYIKDCFAMAIANKTIQQSEIAVLTAHRKKSAAAKTKGNNVNVENVDSL